MKNWSKELKKKNLDLSGFSHKCYDMLHNNNVEHCIVFNSVKKMDLSGFA